MSAERRRSPTHALRVLAHGLRALALGLVAASALAAPMSAPPAEYRPPAAARRMALDTELVLPRTAPARRIALPAPTSEERARAEARRAQPSAATPGRKRGRMLIGFARELPAREAAITLADLAWQRTAAGTQAARIEVTSPGAAGLRLGLTLAGAPAGLAVRFQGNASGASAFGPFGAAEIAGEPVYWSPALQGDTGAIELELPAGAGVDGATLTLPKISHFAAFRPSDTLIGSSGPCEVDVVCAPPDVQQQLATAKKAVARMIMTFDGLTFLCTGTLLNDTQGTFTPYFITADHCFEDPSDPASAQGTAAAAAATINTYWFFEAATCGSLAEPDFIVQAGGAKLLARSVDYDWALVRLKTAPPAGTTFAAWNAAGPIAVGTPFGGIHHPSADLKKLSVGNVQGYGAFPDPTFTPTSTYIEVMFSSGVTEHGSSGSGMFTLNGAGNYYELRGTLTGGSSSCDEPHELDYYGRFDAAYPVVAEYLAPDAPNPAKIVPVVEYYNGVQNDYFLTTDPFEIAGRDNGSPPGWVRTGYRFLAYSDPAVAPAGALPVCRLHAPQPSDDPRFYSASAQECASMLADPALHFLLESNAVFYLYLPDATGACPAGTRPIYRFLNNAKPPHRRYAVEAQLRDSLLADGGWTQEGTGTAPEKVAMCAPVSGAALPSHSAPNYQGLWWNAPAGSESGWGINFNHQGDTIFATWFTYDVDGSALWFVVAATKSGASTYSGTLYRATGPAFSAVPFDPHKVVGTAVGTATFAFSDASNALFTYTIGGVTQAKNVTPQVVGAPVPTCTWGAQPNLALATNYQDLWWADPPESERGWGVNFTHQGNTIFATWFTYGADGKPAWFVVSAEQTQPNVYGGDLYTGTGPPYNGAFDRSKVAPNPVGSATITFADGNHATFAYNVNGVSQSKAITREVFAPPGTVCQ